jgi:hypothetical protein
MLFFIIRLRSAVLSTPREIERVSGSRYEGSPLLMSLTMRLLVTAFSRTDIETSGDTPYLMLIVEQILSSPGLCF